MPAALHLMAVRIVVEKYLVIFLLSKISKHRLMMVDNFKPFTFCMVRLEKILSLLFQKAFIFCFYGCINVKMPMMTSLHLL